MNDIDTKYEQLGGPASVLGRPLHEERGCPDGIGRYVTYQNGSIHWHPATGAHETHGAIRAKWSDLGWERSPLGYPLSDEREPSDAELGKLLSPEANKSLDPASVNRCSDFQGGRIYCWSPDGERYSTTVVHTDGKRTDDEHGVARRVATIVCPNCKKKVHAYRAWGGRILVTTGAGVAVAIVGGIIGAGIGLASGGWGGAATIPLAAMGLVVGAGLGYIVSDKTLDRPTCPHCKHPIDLGF